MITVRLANSNDVKAIVRMGRAFWAAIPHNDSVPYCQDSVAMTCIQMIDQGLLVYAQVDGETAGFAGALACPLFVNRDYLLAAELFWWVVPEYRKSGLGWMILQELEKAAKAAGVRRLSMMAVEGMDLDLVAQMYAKAGYAPVERTWSKSLWQ